MNKIVVISPNIDELNLIKIALNSGGYSSKVFNLETLNSPSLLDDIISFSPSLLLISPVYSLKEIRDLMAKIREKIKILTLFCLAKKKIKQI